MKKFADIRQHDDNIFKVTKQIRKDGKDITGGNNIKDKNWNFCFTSLLKDKRGRIIMKILEC